MRADSGIGMTVRPCWSGINRLLSTVGDKHYYIIKARRSKDQVAIWGNLASSRRESTTL